MSLPTLVLASRNAHKARECAAILAGVAKVSDLTPWPWLPVVEETGTTFLANATLKALTISRHLPHELVLADDSGLEVHALGGAPGVYSSSFGGIEGNHELNNERLLEAMAGIEDRRARFRCTLVLARGGQSLAHFTGTLEGTIAKEATGAHGFGYDPLFVPEGLLKPLATLRDAEKNALSHRFCALKKLGKWLKEHEKFS